METGPDIIIIGAGPSGLVAALTLLQEGQRVAIYDALPKGQNGSRAAAVHAHTLEVTSGGSFEFFHRLMPLQQLHTLGYAEALISKGIKGQGTINYDCNTPIMQAAFAEYLQGVTEYPFALLIPQHEVEHILEEKLNELGVKVRREMRLKGMEASEPGIKLTFENGDTAQATYLIGADGSRSTVRL
jgi:2-polyprenyl-6-methoxyphenol hydroxylase-like FAD-dependent oxidoreductase